MVTIPAAEFSNITTSTPRARLNGQYITTSLSVDRLPVELLQHILLWLPKADLLHICETSRALHDAATRLLLYHVEMHQSQNDQILLWCQLVGDRTDLAHCIKSLTLPLILGGNDFMNTQKVGELHHALSLVLRGLNNLQSLAIVETSIETHLDHYLLPKHIDANIFLGCSFRLKSFSYGGFSSWRSEPHLFWSSAALAAFFREQDEIMHWHSGSEIYLALSNEDSCLLPKLSSIRTTYGTSYSIHQKERIGQVLRLVTSRKITHFRMDIEASFSHLSIVQEISEAMSVSTWCGDHVSYFHFETPMFIWEVINAAMLGTIARIFPKLKIFNYSSSVWSTVRLSATLIPMYAMLICSPNFSQGEIFRFVKRCTVNGTCQSIASNFAYTMLITSRRLLLLGNFSLF